MLRKLCFVFVAVAVIASVPLVASAASPDAAKALCEGGGGSWSQGQCTSAKLNGNTTLQGIIKTIVNVLIFLGAAVAVIMIVIGGMRYVSSGGDQNSVKTAKNTILYAIIGLIVMILAYAAVDFVLSALLSSPKQIKP